MCSVLCALLLVQVPWGCCLQTWAFLCFNLCAFYPVASPCWVICKSLTFCELSHVVGGGGRGGWASSRNPLVAHSGPEPRVVLLYFVRDTEDAGVHPGCPYRPRFSTLMCVHSGFNFVLLDCGVRLFLPALRCRAAAVVGCPRQPWPRAPVSSRVRQGLRPRCSESAAPALPVADLRPAGLGLREPSPGPSPSLLAAGMRALPF